MKIFDYGKNGSISVPELRWAMTKLGAGMDDTAVDEMIKEIDPEKLVNYKNKLIKNFEINELDIKSFVNNVEID